MKSLLWNVGWLLRVLRWLLCVRASTCVLARRAILIGVLAVCTPTGAAHSARPLAVDDVLIMQDVGRVAMVQNGRALVYEWIGPYEKAPNLQAVSIAADRSALAKLFLMDFDKQSPPEVLFDQDSRNGYWLGGLSPDDQKLAIYEISAGEVKAGVYDFASRRLTRFAFTPNYFWLLQRPAWISNDELVYSALPPGDQPSMSLINRPEVVARLNELWQRAFRGVEPSATVIVSTPSGIHDADDFREGKLLRVNVQTGITSELGEGYFYNMRLAPGGRYLAALKEGGRIQPTPDQPAYGDLVHRQLIVFDLRSSAGEAVPCPSCDVVVGTLNWSADGTNLTFFTRNIGGTLEKGELAQYRPATRSFDKVKAHGLRLACGIAVASHVQAIGLRRGVVVFGRPAAGKENDIHLSPSHCERDARHDWFLVATDGEVASLTSSFKSVSGNLVGISEDAAFVLADGEVWRVAEDGSRLNLTREIRAPVTQWGLGSEAGWRSSEAAFTGDILPSTQAVVQTRGQVIFLDLITGHHKAIDKPSQDSTLLSASVSSEAALFRRDRSAGSQLLVRQARKASRSILKFNQHLAGIASARKVRITYTAPGGAQLVSCMLVPTDWNRMQRYPLIVHVYPGVPGGECYSSELSRFDPYNPELLAARGYIVLFAATPTTLVQSPEERTHGLTPIVLAAVDRAIESGYADPNRLAVFGLSQGHHSALQLITQTNRFKAAVAMYGISNLSSHYGTTPLALRLSRDSFGIGNFGRYESMLSPNWLGVKPWEDPQPYIRNSPVFHADQIETPLLLIHSDFDYFPLGQSEEIFSALYRLRKTAVYVTYWGEAHGNLSPANIRDMWDRIFRWFDEHLPGGPSAGPG